MESGKVIAEGHVQLPAIAPGETGKSPLHSSCFFSGEGDVLELEAFDKEGKSICNWTYPIRLAKQYFDHKMAQTPMSPGSGTTGHRHSNRYLHRTEKRPCNRHF